MNLRNVAYVLAAFALAGCGERQQVAMVQIDGSSTVYPVAEAVAEEFQASQGGKVRVTVGVSGTGGGFKKFCRGETDISTASRPILSEEIEACATAGIDYIELPVAYDALTVVIHPDNTWAQEMTVEQLRIIWEPSAQGVVMNWNQVDPSWPDAPIRLFGAGSDSGTFDYFTEAVTGKAKSSRGDYTASEDDNVLVTGVSQDRNAIGYFGLAYYLENATRVKAVKIRLGADAPAVGPSQATVIDGSYQPMSRPAFIYVNAEAARERAELRDFVEFFLAEARPLIEEVKYVPLPDRAYTLAQEKFRINAVLRTVGEEDFAVLKQVFLLLLRHRAAHQVGVTERIAEQTARDLHDLFLIRDDAVGFFQNRAQQIVVVVDLFLPVHTRVEFRDIVHRTRTVERHGGDDVLKLRRAHLPQHLLHPRAFNLEHTNRLAAPDHFERFFQHLILLLVT